MSAHDNGNGARHAAADRRSPDRNGNRSRLRILFVGVGGQGVMTAARALGTALHSLGFDVVAGQLHGMSQRGGSVEAPLLIGTGSGSFIPAGGADVLVAFEPLEALRALPFVGPHTRAFVNRGVIVPVSLSRDGQPYPPLDSIFDRLRQRAARVTPVDGQSLAAAAGQSRTLNMVMLGALAGAGLVPVDAGSLWQALAATAPRDPGAANREAFRLGAGSIADGDESLAGEQ